MRPIRFTYTPSAANLTRFASNVTGGTWTLTETTTVDSLAHTVTIRNDSATDHSGKNAVLVGTDVDGYALTETLALPGSSLTVTSTKFFKTLTSVTPSSTIGADTMDIGMGDSFASSAIGLNWRGGIVGFDIIISGTANYTIQFTESDIQNLDNRNLDWLNSSDSAVVNKTTSSSSNFIAVPIAMRLLCNSQSSSPTIKLDITQRDF